MTRRARRATLNAVVVALVTLVLVSGSGWFASPGSAAADPKRPHKHARKHAAKRHVKKRVSVGLRAVQIANHLTGVPYRWGGASPRAGFDCSGLVQYVYAKVGIRFRTTPPASTGTGAASREARSGPAISSSSRVSATSASTPAAGSSSTRPGAARLSAGRGSRRTGATTAPRASSQPRAACSRCRCGRRRSAAGGRSPAAPAPC